MFIESKTGKFIRDPKEKVDKNKKNGVIKIRQ